MITKIYCDIADIKQIKKFYKKSIVKGFTTNPTLMRKAGAKDYKSYSKKILKVCKKKPISFEVFGDNYATMKDQALKINTWGKNVYVKIPVVNSNGKFMGKIIKELNKKNIKMNITAVYSAKQTKKILNVINKKTKVIISIFAGRIANAGIDPEDTMKYATNLAVGDDNIETLWASSREVFNIIQAERCGTDIITLTPGLIKSMKDLGKDLNQFSLETVKMFYDDAQESGFTL